MKKYVLGVDGGGTKSHLAIFDTEGNKLDFRAWGALNHEVLPGSFIQMEKELEAFLLGAINENGLTHSQLAHCVFGLSGADTKKQHVIISEMLSKLGFNDFTLCNDAYLGIPAACPGSVGICAINGTGCTLAGIDANGKTLQIGGMGGISEDLGGGSQMGKRAVGRVYRELFRAGEPTAMTGMLFKLLGISDKHDFIDVIAEKCDNGSLNIRDCNRLLFEGAKLGDKMALELLRRVAENYAGGVTCMVQDMYFPQDKAVYITLAGSVFVKGESPALTDMFKEMVNERNPGRTFEYVTLQKPPVMGAVIWALGKAGASPEVIDKAREQF